MIISEKQIMQLISCVRTFVEYLRRESDLDEYREMVCLLIDEINNQQSEELKEIN